MKSKLFARFDTSDPDNSEFKADIRALLDITPERINYFIPKATEFLAVRTRKEQKDIENELEEAGLISIVSSRLLRLFRLFLTALEEDDIGVEDSQFWSQDLKELGIINSKDVGVIEHFILGVKESAHGSLTELSKTRTAERGILPYFSGAGSTVELRAVLDKQYNWGDDLDKFEPNIKKLTPIVSVSLNVDSGSPKRFTFQASPRDIEYLITELQSALKIVKSLEEKMDTVNG